MAVPTGPAPTLLFEAAYVSRHRPRPGPCPRPRPRPRPKSYRP